MKSIFTFNRVFFTLLLLNVIGLSMMLYDGVLTGQHVANTIVTFGVVGACRLAYVFCVRK